VTETEGEREDRRKKESQPTYERMHQNQATSRAAR
jgi:hypothetical protein